MKLAMDRQSELYLSIVKATGKSTRPNNKKTRPMTHGEGMNDKADYSHKSGMNKKSYPKTRRCLKLGLLRT